MRLASAILAAALSLAPFVTGAQEPPGRAGRLAFAEGSVSVYTDPEIGWEPAYVNTPITSENSVWTDLGAHAELRVSGTSLRMDEATQLDVSALLDDQFDATLARGALNVRVRHLTGSIAINTPQARFTLLAPGRYRIDADSERGDSRLTVFEGRASMDGGAGSVSVPTGRSIVVWGSDRPAYALQAAFTTEFDRWAVTRDTRWTEQQAPRYVSTYMTGYEDLDANGQWINEPDYGPLWMPTHVANDWVPYRYGHWAWVRPWGWTWIDDEPWGYAPFHYGRWVQVRDRWAWYPGKRIERPVYAPALVAWVGGSNWSVSVRNASAPVVGWYALSPFDRYQPWYQANAAYVNNVNVNTTFTNRDRAFRYAERQREVNRVQTSTIVQRDTFTARRPVQQALVHVTPEVLRQQPVAQQPTTVLPTRNEFVRARTAARTTQATSTGGGNPPAQGAAPSAASTARVVPPGSPAAAPAMAPPTQRPSFARKPSAPTPQAATAGATPPPPSAVARPTAPGQVQFGAGNLPPAPGAQQSFKGQENPARREATPQPETQRAQQGQAARDAQTQQQQQQRAQQEQAARDQQKAQQEQQQKGQQELARQQQQRAQQEQAARDQQKAQQEQQQKAQQEQARQQQQQQQKAQQEQQKAQQEQARQQQQQQQKAQQEQQQKAQQEQARQQQQQQQKAQQEQARQQQQQQQKAQQEQQQKAQQEQARQQQQQQQKAQQEQQQKAQQEQARQQQQQQQKAQQEQQQKAQQEQARQQQQQQQKAQQEQQQKAQQEQARQQQQQQQKAQPAPPSPPPDQAKGQGKGKSKEEEEKEKEKK